MSVKHTRINPPPPGPPPEPPSPPPSRGETLTEAYARGWNDATDAATPSGGPLDVERLRQLSDAASQGLWSAGSESGLTDGIWSDTPTGYDSEEGQGHLVAWCHSDWRADEDAAFIAAAANYVRARLTEDAG